MTMKSDDDTVYSEEELLKRLSHGQQRMEHVRQIMIGLYVLGQQLVNSQCFGMPNYSSQSLVLSDLQIF